MERNVTELESGGLGGACLVFHETDVHEIHWESLKPRRIQIWKPPSS